MHPGGGWNLRVRNGRVEVTDLDMHTLTRESQEVEVKNGRVEVTDLDMHTLTRESQEVMVGLILVTTFPIDVVLVDL